MPYQSPTVPISRPSREPRRFCSWTRNSKRTAMTNSDMRDLVMSKVPAVTLAFWIIKIAATTLGETGGDTVTMSWLGETKPNAGQGGLNGYLGGTGIFGLLA